MERAVIVVPLYNEEKRFHKAAFIEFARLHSEINFLFVNDGSTDNTMAIIEEVCQELKDQMSSLHLSANAGKANAVRMGFCQVLDKGYQYVGYWDADLATPLPSILSFMEVLKDKPEINLVIGARVNLLGRSIRRKTVRHYIGRVFATIVSSLLKLSVYDTQCGAKLFRSGDYLQKIMEKDFVSKWIFDVEVIKRMNEVGVETKYAIYEYPLESWVDVDGSKLRAKDFVRIIGDLIKIFRKEN